MACLRGRDQNVKLPKSPFYVHYKDNDYCRGRDDHC